MRSSSKPNRRLTVFIVVVLAHFAEHVAQVVQLYVLHWPRPQALGLLGLAYPPLMHSEWLHYSHALFMLLGLAALRHEPYGGRWWTLALWLGFYHHIEHALLLGQALIHQNLAGCGKAPCTLVQVIWGIQRIELHLFYNFMVLLPMLIALYTYRKHHDTTHINY